jgi:hypothetical protein
LKKINKKLYVVQVKYTVVVWWTGRMGGIANILEKRRKGEKENRRRGEKE